MIYFVYWYIYLCITLCLVFVCSLTVDTYLLHTRIFTLYLGSAPKAFTWNCLVDWHLEEAAALGDNLQNGFTHHQSIYLALWSVFPYTRHLASLHFTSFNKFFKSQFIPVSNFY